MDIEAMDQQGKLFSKRQRSGMYTRPTGDSLHPISLPQQSHISVSNAANTGGALSWPRSKGDAKL